MKESITQFKDRQLTTHWRYANTPIIGFNTYDLFQLKVDEGDILYTLLIDYQARFCIVTKKHLFNMEIIQVITDDSDKGAEYYINELQNLFRSHYPSEYCEIYGT